MFLKKYFFYRILPNLIITNWNANVFIQQRAIISQRQIDIACIIATHQNNGEPILGSTV